LSEVTPARLVPGGEERWAPFRPEQVQALLEGMAAPWWIAGGWAMDLFLEQVTRPHGDIEIAVLRKDQLVLQRQLSGWEVRIADIGALVEWPSGFPLPETQHALWVREPSIRDAWQLEITFERSEGTRWIYRRDARISRDLDELGLRDPRGIPYLRPEIVLLYKSKARRAVDEADRDRLLPRMDPAGREWLARALATIDPAHPWLEGLASATR
jgi:hypothetical protein